MRLQESGGVTIGGVWSGEEAGGLDDGGEPVPPRVLSARAMRLPDGTVFDFLALVAADAPASSPDSALCESDALEWLLLSSGVNGGELRKDCLPRSSSMRKRAVTTVQPEWIFPSDSSLR